MTAEAQLAKLPRWASKAGIVRLFQKGLPVETIAGLIGCVPTVVEDVLREALKRQETA